ncbi:MarR family winged helix-turn-helix transcriptional regulator [Nisaea sediminum]|uniref:MarR family winged helix-turn-helix transcriptional regulator n=1 Tax=Nisaea sediminum TaxID=2775867 RepID=UPI001867576E|nr:MarR family transcriptional regulator [Nisaea sediminum]
MERVEECVSFLVGKAAQRISRRAKELLAQFDVTPPQYVVLKVLSGSGGQTAREVGDRLAIDAATITGILDRLEKAGLVERRDDPADRRIYRLELTDRARALAEPLDEAMDTLNREARDMLGPSAGTVFEGLRALSGR